MVRQSTKRLESRVIAPAMLAGAAAFIAGASAAWAAGGDGSPVSVYLLAGQSNMGGRALIANAPEAWALEQRDVLCFYGSDYHGESGWVPLQPGSANVASPDGLFGPELSFGRELADALPDAQVALIKYSRGGTHLAGHWSPETGTYYQKFVTTVINGLAQLELMGYEPTICGMIWMQGEEDAEWEDMALAYEANLTAFIPAVRAFVGVDDMPFVLGRINAPTREFRGPVRDAQDAVGSTAWRADVFSTDDLPLRDTVHYDAEGQIELGYRFADAMLELVDVGACIGDLDASGDVGPADLAMLLGDWGASGAGDLDGDGATGPADLAVLLGGWGGCP